MNIILLGAPGAGKGTQGQLLSRFLKIPWISIGELFRREIAKKTPLGIEIQKYVDKGQNVPADLALKVLDGCFKNCSNGFILDNYPRNIDQLNAFKAYIKEQGLKFHKVIHLVVSEDASVRRLLKRAELDRKQKGKARNDETLDIIRIRIEQGYKKDIEPIKEYFERLRVLANVNGEDTIENVHRNILKLLKG